MLWKDFPGHPVVRSPPANAEHTSSVPGLEGFHRPGEAAEPMHCGTHEPQLLKPTHPRACAPQQEKPAEHSKERLPLTAIREKCAQQTKTQYSQKSIYKIILKKRSGVWPA